jgi:DNA-binding NtrC family response regulator
MSTILLFEDDVTDRAIIRRAVFCTDHTLIEAEALEDVADHIASRQVDLMIVSLATVSDEMLPRFQQLLSQMPATKIMALTPPNGADRLTTLLRAESLGAHHLMPKPIDPQQLLTILNLTFALPTQ